MGKTNLCVKSQDQLALVGTCDFGGLVGGLTGCLQWSVALETGYTGMSILWKFIEAE